MLTESDLVTELCQSPVMTLWGPRVMGLRCSNRASRELAGVQLCGSHERYWRPSVALGEPIEVHPESLKTAAPGMRTAVPLPTAVPRDPPLASSPPRQGEEPGGRDEHPTRLGHLGATDALKRVGVYVYDVEFACLQCGRPTGAVTVVGRQTLAPPPAGRCKTCGGQPFATGERTRRFARVERLSDTGARRGRPPMWLVRQRARERELDQQLAVLA